MIIFLLVFLFATPVFADDATDTKIATLDSQANDLLAQRQALLDDWKANDPDMKIIERLKLKNKQQRDLADQANALLQQKQALIDEKNKAAAEVVNAESEASIVDNP